MTELAEVSTRESILAFILKELGEEGNNDVINAYESLSDETIKAIYTTLLNHHNAIKNFQNRTLGNLELSRANLTKRTDWGTES